MPSSAGAHTPGIEKAPAALRTAGLVSTLGADDHGDLPVRRWRPDRDHPNGQNPDVVAQVAAETAAAVATVAATGQTPLVLGGDCSITVGAVAGLLRDGGELTLLYMDGGPDLYTPETRANGNFDAMGVAHLLRLPGHVPGIAPLSLTPDRVVSYGHRMPPDDHESVLLDRLGIAGVHARDINRDPDAAAARALDLVTAPRFLLHFDVDVLDFKQTPIADVPDSGDEPGGGLSPEAMAVSLDAFAADPRLAGLVLTEVNPDHAPEPATLVEFAARVAGALDGSAAGRRGGSFPA